MVIFGIWLSFVCILILLSSPFASGYWQNSLNIQRKYDSDSDLTLMHSIPPGYMQFTEWQTICAQICGFNFPFHLFQLKWRLRFYLPSNKILKLHINQFHSTLCFQTCKVISNRVSTHFVNQNVNSSLLMQQKFFPKQSHYTSNTSISPRIIKISILFIYIDIILSACSSMQSLL